MTNAVNLSTVAATGFLRNRIINGAMVIDQRNAGASVTISGAGQVQYVMDRFFHYNNTGTTYTAQQSTDAPTNFSNSALASFGASVSPAAGTDGAHITQVIEGFNIADFNWGTANALPVTLSFWAKSGLTGSHGLSLLTNYSGGVTTIGYPALYTINAANTWEYKTVTIPGPTTGTWNTTNGAGLFVRWYFCAGSNFNATPNTWSIRTGAYGSPNSIYGYAPTGMLNLFQSGNTFRVTGVQLEVGTVATPFERRLYGTELALCQRYYISAPLPSIVFNINQYSSANFPVTMRASPTVTVTPTGGVISAITPSTNGFYALSNSTVGASFTASIEL